MTRRALLFSLAVSSGETLTLPVHLVTDTKSYRARSFEPGIWQEAARDLRRCGIGLEVTRATGEVGKPSQREPVITGLARNKLNVVITDQIPMYWDHARALNGVTLLYRGYHVCVIAMNWAHGHHLPFVSVNTCLHEILHALLGDIFERRPPGWKGNLREVSVDVCATRMWLFGDRGAIRDAAQSYLQRLSA